MNQPPENETETIRSEIDTTRRRIDDTMDELGDRLKGRHLLDEILGFFRSDSARGSELREKLSETANSAAQSFVNTVKSNPMPLLLVGAGVGWMIYESRRKMADAGYSDQYDDDDTALYRQGTQDYSDQDAEYDRPLEYPSSSAVASASGQSEYETEDYPAAGAGNESGSTSKLGQAKEKVVEKATQAKQRVRQTISNVGERVREKSQAISDQARDLGSRAQENARQVYDRSRERVVTTTREHPLEVGLGCLALGVIAGLALPTPKKLNRVAGPAADRLRDKTRDAGRELLQKGQRVASAAASAAKNEAQSQGLTFDRLREQAGAVADRAKEAAGETAQRENVSPGQNHPSQPTPPM